MPAISYDGRVPIGRGPVKRDAAETCPPAAATDAHEAAVPTIRSWQPYLGVDRVVLARVRIRYDDFAHVEAGDVDRVRVELRQEVFGSEGEVGIVLRRCVEDLAAEQCEILERVGVTPLAAVLGEQRGGEHEHCHGFCHHSPHLGRAYLIYVYPEINQRSLNDT